MSAVPIHTLDQRVALFRQPVVERGRTVRAYAVRAAVTSADGGWLDEQDAASMIAAAYTRLDLHALGGDRPVILRATRGMLELGAALPTGPRGLLLELGAALADEDAPRHVAALRARGVEVVVGDYTGTPAQDALLPLAWAVKVDGGTEQQPMRELVARAHGARRHVVVERVTDAAARRAALAAGADLVQGPMLAREPDGPLRKARAGELQCLGVISLLSAPEVDVEAVHRMVAADPELSIRMLHVVNSSAYALHHVVDSLRHAVILLGPHRLAALAMASLIDARPTAIGPLWAVLTRALACRELTGEDAAYTVGLLSAVASQKRIDITSLLSKAGVSPQVEQAIVGHTGRLGTALAAVVAHEENDFEQVRATGLDPADVARAYFDAVPVALSTATALSVQPLG